MNTDAQKRIDAALAIITERQTAIYPVIHAQVETTYQAAEYDLLEELRQALESF